MEDVSQYGLSRQGSSVWRSLRDGDFEEEDVWAVFKERKDCSSKAEQSMESYFPVKQHLPSAARMIPRANSAITSSSSSPQVHGVKQQSAPVNIPRWSKISGNKSKKVSSKTCSWLGDIDDDDGGFDDCGDSDDEDEDEHNSKMPPHELLARRLARSQISSFSVFEGVGRKLKGRDLSRVRNAVLTKTGFLE